MDYVELQASESLIDRTWLQRGQDYFADASGLFLFALDDQGKQLTDISGRDMREIGRISQLINKRQVDDLYKRVMQTKLEEQIVENTEYSNMKMAAVAIKSGTEALFCFIVCAVYYDPDGENAIFNIRSLVDENIFFGGLDYLREVYDRIYDNTFLLRNQRLEAEKLKESSLALTRALKQSEAMTEVVQLLDSDDRFEEVCSQLCRISGKSAGVSHTYVVAPSDGRKVDVKGRYRSDNANPVIEQLDKAILYGYLESLSEKPVVVSSRTEIDYEFRLWLGSIGVTAFVALPIFSGRPKKKLSMYIIFADNDPARLWNREETKFFSDVAKVLQSIYDRRINKASLSASYNSLQIILDNVGSCVFVKDAGGNEVLFRNREMNETFKEELKNGEINELLKREEASKAFSDGFYELEYNAREKLYKVHSKTMDWVDGRKAIMYSLFDITDRREKLPAAIQDKDGSVPALRETMEDGSDKETEQDINISKDISEEDRIRAEEEKRKEEEIRRAEEDRRREEDIRRAEEDRRREEEDRRREEEDRRRAEEDRRRAEGEKKTEETKKEDQNINEQKTEEQKIDEEKTEEQKTSEEKISEQGLNEPKTEEYRIREEEQKGTADREKDFHQYGEGQTGGLTKENDLVLMPVIDIKRGNICQGAGVGCVYKGKKDTFENAGNMGTGLWKAMFERACILLKKLNESGHPYFRFYFPFPIRDFTYPYYNRSSGEASGDMKEALYGERALGGKGQDLDINNLLYGAQDIGLNPKNMVLEIREEDVIADPLGAKKIIEGLKDAGFKSTVTGFGSGRLTVNKVSETGADMITLSDQLAAEVLKNPYAGSFVRMTVESAEALKLKVCMAGIETSRQLRAVEEMNINLVRGGYFDKGLNETDFENKYL